MKEHTMSVRIETSSSVKLFLRDDQDRALVLLRSENPNHFKHIWDLPGGKVDPGESPDGVLLREPEEETGLTCDALTELGERQFDIDEISYCETLYSVDLVGPAGVHLSNEHVEYRRVALESPGSEGIPLMPGLAESANDCKEFHNDRL